MCTYPVQPVCTSLLHIPLAHPSCSYYYLLSPNILFCTSYLFCTFYSIAHFTLYFYLYICSCVVLLLCYFYIIFIFIILHCPLSGPDLIYISLLIIPCIIYYVTNKETLNLEICLGLKRTTFDCSWTTGVRTSDCGELLASARTDSMGEVENLPWIPCIGSRSSWVAGTSMVGPSRVLSGRPKTKLVWALKAIINGSCDFYSISEGYGAQSVWGSVRLEDPV